MCLLLDTYSTHTPINLHLYILYPHTHTNQTNDHAHNVGSRKLICELSHIRLMERERDRERWLEGWREENTPFSSWLIFPISSRHNRNLLQLKHHSGDRLCVCMSVYVCAYAELMAVFYWVENWIKLCLSNSLFSSSTPSLHLLLLSSCPPSLHLLTTSFCHVSCPVCISSSLFQSCFPRTTVNSHCSSFVRLHLMLMSVTRYDVVPSSISILVC